jgi:hydrogenase maturation factor
MRAHPLGRDSVRVGTVTNEHAGLVVMRTEIGGSRILERPYGAASHLLGEVTAADAKGTSRIHST